MALSRRTALSGLCLLVCILFVCRIYVFATATTSADSGFQGDSKLANALQALLGTTFSAAGSAPSSASSPSAALSSFDPNGVCSPAGASTDPVAQRSDLADFSHVNVSGDGWNRANAFEQSCFQIQAFDSQGGPFDVGCRQRAFLVATMRLIVTMDGDTSLADVQAPRVQYLPESSSHLVCYTVHEHGLYSVRVALLWGNAFLLRQALNPALADGFFRSKVVAQQNITVAAAAASVAMENGTDSAPLSEQSLPRCTFSILRDSRNPGFWRGDTWHPTACRLPDPIAPARIGRCLHGKSVLILGDSQMRYLFGNLQILLHYRTRCRYLRRYRRQPREVHRVRVKNVVFQDEPPMDPATATAYAANYSSYCGQTTYWGNFWSGFALQQVRVQPVRRRGPSFAFNLTYATHMGSDYAVFDDWRSSSNLTGGPIATHFAPFDIVAVSFGLHDITRKKDAQELSEAFKSVFLPSLQSVVRDAANVTFFGMWAAQEKAKPQRYLYKSNNVRGFTFDDTIARISEEKNFGHFVDLQALTLPRGDRCTDSTHYSWPITLAMLDIWLSAVCEDVDTSESEPKC
ncbi:hypothetical protein CLOM_g24469 [Closterium sp. NIES-68]|nr:hypothetical protein CLOM_g24469 [Closterium sp. NIES-68]GJP85090.1 hypothetical protein CLOP_g15191 [Closterium sp. NIES-67]